MKVGFPRTKCVPNTGELPLSLAIAVAVFPDSPLIALVLVIGPLLELPILSITANLRLGLRNKSADGRQDIGEI